MTVQFFRENLKIRGHNRIKFLLKLTDAELIQASEPFKVIEVAMVIEAEPDGLSL
jgi:hypothetical protein